MRLIELFWKEKVEEAYSTGRLYRHYLSNDKEFLVEVNREGRQILWTFDKKKNVIVEGRI